MWPALGAAVVAGGAHLGASYDVSLAMLRCPSGWLQIYSLQSNGALLGQITCDAQLKCFVRLRGGRIVRVAGLCRTVAQVIHSAAFITAGGAAASAATLLPMGLVRGTCHRLQHWLEATEVMSKGQRALRLWRGGERERESEGVRGCYLYNCWESREFYTLT